MLEEIITACVKLQHETQLVKLVNLKPHITFSSKINCQSEPTSVQQIDGTDLHEGFSGPATVERPPYTLRVSIMSQLTYRFPFLQINNVNECIYCLYP